MIKEHYTVTLVLEGDIELITRFKTEHNLDLEFGDTKIGSSKIHPNIGLAHLELFTHEGTQDKTNAILCEWIKTNYNSLSQLGDINKTVMVNTFTLQQDAYSWFKFTPEAIRAVDGIDDLHLSVMTYRVIEGGS